MARLGRSQIVYRPRRRGVEASPVVFAPVRVKLTDQNRPRQIQLQRWVHSRLGDPQKTNMATVFDPVRVYRAARPAHSGLQHGSTYKLRPPTVIGPVAAGFMPDRIRAYTFEVERPRQWALQRGPWYKLRPPTVIGAVPFRPAPVKVVVTAMIRKRYVSHPKLGPPTVVDPATVFDPVRLKLDRTPRKLYVTNYKLRAPIVVSPPVVFGPLRTKLTGQRRRVDTIGRVSPPAVVGASVPVGGVALTRLLVGVGI